MARPPKDKSLPELNKAFASLEELSRQLRTIREERRRYLKAIREAGGDEGICGSNTILLNFRVKVMLSSSNG